MEDLANSFKKRDLVVEKTDAAIEHGVIFYRDIIRHSNPDPCINCANIIVAHDIIVIDIRRYIVTINHACPGFRGSHENTINTWSVQHVTLDGRIIDTSATKFAKRRDVHERVVRNDQVSVEVAT